MALKDLISDSAKLTEEAIEKIVKPYVGYDVEGKRLTLNPAFGKLGVKQKIIVYLVALRGWPFVIEGNDLPSSETPAEMEKKLSIPGGSLRPALRDLSDAHIISEVDHRYSVEPASLNDLSAILDGSSAGRAPRRKQKGNARKATPKGKAA